MKALEIALVVATAAGSPLALAQDRQELPARADHDVMAPITWHHAMHPLMRELSQEIERIGAALDEAAAAPVHERERERIEELSAAVAKMSGLLARPAHAAQDDAQLVDMERRVQTLEARPSTALTAERNPAPGG